MTSRIQSISVACLLLGALAAASPAAVQDETAKPPGLKELLEKVAPSLVTIESIIQIQDRSGRLREVEGSDFGVIVDSTGIVVTEGSIYFEDPRFSKPKNIVISLASGEAVDAQFLGKDVESDLSFLVLEPRDEPYPFVDFSRAASIEVGDQVVVFGALPRIFQFERKFVLTRVNAAVTRPKKLFSLMDDVSDSVAGPVFTLQGLPVGLVSTTTRGGSSGARSFLLPAESFMKVLENPPEHEKKESKAWLGISFQVLNEKLAKVLGMPGERGVVVSRVYPGMPADQAGIIVDDTIVEMGGEEIPASKDSEDAQIFINMIREQEVGTKIPLKVYRDGKELEISVSLAERPKSPAEAQRFSVRDLGLIVREITFFDTVDLSLEEGQSGVIVQSVEPALPAGLAQVRVEDIVKTVNGEPVEDIKDFRRIMGAAAGQDIVLFIRRDHQTKFIQIRAS
ncbi:MAG: PDZ domain-containing protein [Planctomycetota bacterium]|nr:PDZ domain-containing protein [Planctomycetota bacterium]